MQSLHEVYLFYSSQHAQWRIGTNYEGPKAAGCLIYINSKGIISKCHWAIYNFLTLIEPLP